MGVRSLFLCQNGSTHPCELWLATQDLLAPGFYAAASFTYNDNEFTEDAAVFPGAGSLVSKGDQLRRTPKNTWALDLGRENAIGGRFAGYARANYAGASTATGSPDAERAVRVSTLRPRTIALKFSCYR